MNVYNISADTLALMQKTLGARFDGLSWNPLEKSAMTTGNNVVGYDLQAPARLLVPFITPIRNSLPRRSRAANPGTASHWKQITAITDSGYPRQGWTNEGARATQLNYSAVDKTAAYQTIGAEDALTFEAESAAQGFEDANALATFILLEQMMVKEEMALLAGNNSIALGTPTTPTTSVAGTGATIPTATYTVRVVALTIEGFAAASVTGGLPTQKAVTGVDGKVQTINGGVSIRSAGASQAVTLGENLRASTPVINGAVAYAWFIGTGGTEYLQAITTINSVQLSSYTTSGRQTSAAFTVDYSANNGTLGGGTNQVTAFDGLVTSTFANGALGNAYVSALATGTAGTGTKLTASGKGTVNEIDAVLLYLWNTWRISPTKIWVNAQEQRDITTLCLNASSGPLLRIDQAASGGEYSLTAGGQISYYFNPFTVNGGTKLPVMIHPDLPPGTVFFQCETLPAYYKSNQTPTVAEVLTRRDYYRIDWPLTTRERQYGVYSEEVLANYAPFGFAILTNIAPQ